MISKISLIHALKVKFHSKIRHRDFVPLLPPTCFTMFHSKTVFFSLSISANSPLTEEFARPQQATLEGLFAAGLAANLIEKAVHLAQTAKSPTGRKASSEKRLPFYQGLGFLGSPCLTHSQIWHFCMVAVCSSAIFKSTPGVELLLVFEGRCHQHRIGGDGPLTYPKSSQIYSERHPEYQPTSELQNHMRQDRFSSCRP